MATTTPFEPTHIVKWRYRDLKPLKKALKDFGFDKKDVKLRKPRQSNEVEIQLPEGRTLTDEQRQELLKKAHEIKAALPTESESSSDD